MSSLSHISTARPDPPAALARASQRSRCSTARWRGAMPAHGRASSWCSLGMSKLDRDTVKLCGEVSGSAQPVQQGCDCCRSGTPAAAAAIVAAPHLHKPLDELTLLDPFPRLGQWELHHCPLRGCALLTILLAAIKPAPLPSCSAPLGDACCWVFVLPAIRLNSPAKVARLPLPMLACLRITCLANVQTTALRPAVWSVQGQQ